MPTTERRLLLLRHAKSDWPDGVVDYERPLAPRGRRDAVAVGRWLSRAGARPDLALVSGARRAVQTWEALAAEAGGAGEVVVTDDAYDAGAGDLLDLVRASPDAARSVLLVGHNPGIEHLADLLDDGTEAAADRQRRRLKYPTSGLTDLRLPGNWLTLDPQTCRLAAFVVPRG